MWEIVGERGIPESHLNNKITVTRNQTGPLLLSSGMNCNRIVTLM
jgi:hypothetical protein